MGYAGAVVSDELSYYQQMIDNITEYEVIRLDDNGIVQSWHAGAERLTQYTAEEIIGRPVSVFYPPEEAASGRVEQDLRIARDTGRCESEGWRVRKDGSQFLASTLLTPIHVHGTVVGYVKVSRDLNERREQQLAALGAEQMLEAITDYEVIRLDRDGYVGRGAPAPAGSSRTSPARTARR